MSLASLRLICPSAPRTPQTTMPARLPRITHGLRARIITTGTAQRHWYSPAPSVQASAIGTKHTTYQRRPPIPTAPTPTNRPKQPGHPSKQSTPDHHRYGSAPSAQLNAIGTAQGHWYGSAPSAQSTPPTKDAHPYPQHPHLPTAPNSPDTQASKAPQTTTGTAQRHRHSSTPSAQPNATGTDQRLRHKAHHLPKTPNHTHSADTYHQRRHIPPAPGLRHRKSARGFRLRALS